MALRRISKEVLGYNAPPHFNTVAYDEFIEILSRIVNDGERFPPSFEELVRHGSPHKFALLHALEYFGIDPFYRQTPTEAIREENILPFVPEQYSEDFRQQVAEFVMGIVNDGDTFLPSHREGKPEDTTDEARRIAWEHFYVDGTKHVAHDIDIQSLVTTISWDARDANASWVAAEVVAICNGKRYKQFELTDQYVFPRDVACGIAWQKFSIDAYLNS